MGLDKNYANICVGDYICDADGVEYLINSYGMAVAVEGGGTHKLSDLKDVYVMPDKATTTPSKKETNLKKETNALKSEVEDDLSIEEKKEKGNEEPKKKLVILKPNPLSTFSDTDLVSELRARGYKVKAIKRTVIEI